MTAWALFIAAVCAGAAPAWLLARTRLNPWALAALSFAAMTAHALLRVQYHATPQAQAAPTLAAVLVWMLGGFWMALILLALRRERNARQQPAP